MRQPTVTLGISEEHDAGVAILKDGRLLWAANEERYSRVKFQTGTPRLALSKLMDAARTKKLSISRDIALASTFHIDNNLGDWNHLDWHYELLERVFSFTHLDRFLWGTHAGALVLRALGWLQRMPRFFRLRRALGREGIIHPRFHVFDHHYCHAAAAYITSGWRDCIVITQDASGDGYCSKVFVGKNGRLTEKHAVPFFHSPGHYYEYVTFLFGFKLGREGKVTGLAAHGDPSATYPIFEKEMSYDLLKARYRNHALYRKPEINRLRQLLAGYSREDIAAGVQKHLETMMTRYVSDMIVKYARKRPVNLAVAGGVFANVRLNEKIAQLSAVRSFYVYPHMGDGGLAAGAAFALALARGQKPVKIPHVYLGDVPDDNEIAQTLTTYKGRLMVSTPGDLAGEVVRLLARGKVVAVVRGSMEYGPRALGHRTLLSAATDPALNDWLNKRLKRSEFMPFAPILRADDLPRYFEGWKKVLPSLPYMTVTVACTKRCRREAPAIVHVDNSARPQIVRKQTEPFIYEVLTKYRRRTGLRVLINTSYNIHEEPIVRTPAEAVKTFLDGRIDALVLENRLITVARRLSR